MSRNLPWFRMYSELLHDRKIKRIVRQTQFSKMEVVGAWASFLCLANDSNDRGSLLIGNSPVTQEDLEDELGMNSAEIEGLLLSFEDHEMIDIASGTISISNWETRQPNSDSAADKQKRYRDRKKAEKQPKKDPLPEKNGNKNNALRNGYPPDKEEEKDIDKEKEQEINFSSASADPIHALFSPLERFMSIPFEKKSHHKFGKDLLIRRMVGHESKFAKIWEITVFFMDYCKMPKEPTYENDLYDLLNVFDIWPKSNEKILSFISDFQKSKGVKPWPSQVISEVQSWTQPSIQINQAGTTQYHQPDADGGW